MKIMVRSFSVSVTDPQMSVVGAGHGDAILIESILRCGQPTVFSEGRILPEGIFMIIEGINEEWIYNGRMIGSFEDIVLQNQECKGLFGFTLHTAFRRQSLLHWWPNDDVAKAIMKKHTDLEQFQQLSL